MAKQKKPLEPVTGLYTALPHSVMDSLAYREASDKAKSLLCALMRQHNGQNNGHLHLVSSWLKKHGWPSVSSNIKAREELLERGLIIQTRHGGLNFGSDLFALTWLSISNFIGLEISDRTYQRGKYLLCNEGRKQTRKPPNPSTRKRKASSDDRNSPVPATGIVKLRAVPTTGTKKAAL
jgi:hypothetical protein